MKPGKKDKHEHKHSKEEQSLPKAELDQLNKSIKELREQVDSLEKEKEEIFSKLQRVSADYANFQKRAPKQISDSINYEKDRLIKSFLPVLDNFDHTLQQSKQAENVDAVLKGINIIYDHLLEILKSYGVEQIKAAGEMFDPNLHQAMMQQSNPDEEEGVILEEFQKGYAISGRVLRPSKVIVNKPAEIKPAPEDEQKQTEGEDTEEDFQKQPPQTQ